MFSVCGNQTKPSKDKNLVISFSLLMRLFEWCHEDAKDDVAMHKVMEKLVAFNDGVNPLTIDVYDCVVAEANDGQESDESTQSDYNNAYELGVEQAELGNELSNNGRDYSIVAGEIISDDKGEGVSNDELEAFWNGYEGKPLKQGCWTEIDMNNDIEKVNQCYHSNELVNAPKMTFSDEFDRYKPTTLNIHNNEDCQYAAGSMLDVDTLEQIQQVINAGRL